jgi:hypothetical protein
MSGKDKPRVQVVVLRHGPTVDVTATFTNLTPARARMLEALLAKPISAVVPDLEDSTRTVMLAQKKTRLNVD